MALQIGALALGTEFLIAYGCGLLVLLLFCLERFNQPTAADGSFVETLVPRAVADGMRYNQTFVVYVAILGTVYTGLSLVGPYLFAAFQATEETGFDPANVVSEAQAVFGPAAGQPVPAWVPLAVLLILTGGATHFKVLNQVEFFARRLTHRLIGIPHDIQHLAESVRDRRIAVAGLNEADRSALAKLFAQATAPLRPGGGPSPDARPDIRPDIREVEAALDANDVLRRWLRLAFLCHMVETQSLPAGFAKIVRRDYGYVWDRVLRTVLDLRGRPERVALLASDGLALDEAGRELRAHTDAQVEAALHDLHALIAVGLSPHRSNPAALRAIADKLRLTHAPVRDNTLLNRVLLAALAVFAGVLVATFALRDDPLEAFRWASGSFALHGAAALWTWRVYERRSLRNTWHEMHVGRLEIPTAQYLGVALRGWLGGTLALALWHGAVAILETGQAPRVGPELMWIPAFGSLGAMTAFWTAYDFDLVHRPVATMPRRAAQVALQALTTAAVAAFVTLALQRAALDATAGDVAVTAQQIAEARALAREIGLSTLISAGILGAIACFLTARPEPAPAPERRPALAPGRTPGQTRA